MKHRTPKINPSPKKQHTITEKNAKQDTNLHKPRQAQTAQTTHTKGALCEKQHNTV